MRRLIRSLIAEIFPPTPRSVRRTSLLDRRAEARRPAPAEPQAFGQRSRDKDSGSRARSGRPH